MTRESNVKRQVEMWLNTLPHVWYIKTHGSIFGKKGTPDFILCWKGRFVAIELKTEGERPDKAQEIQMKRIRQASGDTIVATSLAQVRYELSGIMNWLGDSA